MGREFTAGMMSPDPGRLQHTQSPAKLARRATCNCPARRCWCRVQTAAGEAREVEPALYLQSL